MRSTGATAVDWNTLDWARVHRVRYKVRQHYRYTYSQPVFDLQQRLMVVPPARFADQRLLNFRLEVRGVEHAQRSLAWQLDPVGNRVCLVSAGRVEHAIDFEAEYTVERAADAILPSSGYRPLAFSVRPYLEQTALTAPDDRIREAAYLIRATTSSPESRVRRALDWASASIRYQFGVTGVQTPAAMALNLGFGVCQDYAHILLSLLRLLAIPARYVSGHLLGEGAPHAWVQAFVPHSTVSDAFKPLVLDPTHEREAGLNYITVATGRDFADVSPTSGVFNGTAKGKLSSSKQAEITFVEYHCPSSRRAEVVAA